MTRATGSAIGGGPLSNGRDGLGDDHLALRWLGDNPSPIAAPADLTALSNETRVNTATTLDQADSAVTGLLNGGFVVVWASNGQDGSSHGVYGQRYNAAGAAVGGEFPINSTTAGSQAIPSVSALDDGGFVVTWRGSDADGFGVFGQRYAANGAAAGGEFAVNQTTSQAQDGASVTGLVGGGFVVVWESFGQDGSDEGIYARAYGANGAPLGNEFRINQTTVSAQAYPTVAATADGGFAVSWASFHQDGSFTYNIYARTYDANLAASAEFPVNTTTAGAQTIPAAAGLLGGGFVIAWYSTGQDGGTIGVYAQRYGANGAPVGGEFLVNETSAGDQLYPSVTALANGGFAISWQSNGQDGAGAGTYARAFTGDGLGGDEILVNQTTAGEQATSDFSHQSIAGLIDGSLVVTWEGNGPGDADGIFQRRFDVEDVTIPGGAGADSLVGGAGGEQLEGKGGADTL
ncbi:MAG: hypothetical protein H7X93_01595, partial [Sphingomonadaceae bacterium]|nr:hypothetical protein [Sphingomonadaceae bacterium]